MSETVMDQAAATTTEGAGSTVSAEGSTSTAEATLGQGSLAAAEAGATEATKPDGQEQAEAKPEDKPQDDKPAGPPEKYEFRQPDGVSLNDKVIEAYSEVAKELGLPQEAAQKVIDKVGPAMAQLAADQQKALVNGWIEQSKADKEFGGANLKDSLVIANRAINQFASPALKELLGKSGLAEHPEVIRLFTQVGKSISEDKVIVSGNTSTAAAAGAKDAAKSLYPSAN